MLNFSKHILCIIGIQIVNFKAIGFGFLYFLSPALTKKEEWDITFRMKLILKHSYRCPISARAKGEVDRFLQKYLAEYSEPLEFELVDVVDNRDRSDELSRQTGIPHESPQAILFDGNGEVCWHCSHRNVTREAILEAVCNYLGRT